MTSAGGTSPLLFMALMGICVNNLITQLSLCLDRTLTTCGPARGSHPSPHPVTETPGHDGRCAQQCAGPPPAVASGEGQGSAGPASTSHYYRASAAVIYPPGSL